MPDAVALGSDGAAPLTAGDWRDAARAVAVARRAGATAVSVRHITFHLSMLDFSTGQDHAHGSHAHGPARAPARGRGLRSACLGRSRGRCAGAAPAAPPPTSSAASPSAAPACAAADAAVCAVSAPNSVPRRTRGWLRSAAFHFRRRMALRHAFSVLVRHASDSSMQCERPPHTLHAARPCAPYGSPYAGSANPHESVGAGVWPRGVKRAASSPPPSISSHDADVPSATPITSLLAPMNVHAPAFYPPDDSEL